MDELTPTESYAVTEINRIVRAGGLQTMDALGNYVLVHFYDNDPKQYADRGEKDVSLAKVADDPLCEVSVSTLARSVGIHLMLEAQPKLRDFGLSPTHHRALLTVADPEQRLALAQRAQEEKISGPDFEKMLAKPPATRKSKRPAWAQKRAKVSASIRSQMRHAPSKEAFTGLSRSEARKTLDAMERDAAAYASYVAEMRRFHDELLGTNDGLEGAGEPDDGG